MSDTIWGIIIGALVTVVVTWISTRSTNKRLNTTTHILAGLIEGSIRGDQVSVRRNKKGQLIGLSFAVAKNDKVGIGESIVVVLKKANETEGKGTPIPLDLKK